MSRLRHECPDWDYLEIDEHDAEFEACTCELGPEAEELRERLIDGWNQDDLA